MIVILSPAKSLKIFDSSVKIKPTVPEFLPESKILADHFKKLSITDLEKLMKISTNLAKLNCQRFKNFQLPFNENNAHPALFSFDGDVYQKMDITNYNADDLKFAQKNLRILSGLYGVLRPLDLMQAYRLEMGTNTKKIIGQNLDQLWQDKIANFFNQELVEQAERTIINLASAEYFTAINPAKISAKIINIIFKEKQGNSYKIIGLFAKQARGLMADFIIKNKIEKSADLQQFNVAGYQFKKDASDQNNWSFYRG